MKSSTRLLFFSFFVLASPRSYADFEDWSDRELAGQLMIVGMRNLQQVRDLQPGGVILFSWNMPNVEKTKRLTGRLKQMAKSWKLPLLIATDHEGGEVLRIRRGVTAFPDAAVVGATRSPTKAYEVGKRMGLELRELGINTNLAPVLDLGNARSFLRNRVWGSHPVHVATMTSAYIKGLSDSRVLSVAKHFPGHGSTSIDSHHALPINPKKLSQLWRSDLGPFREAIRQDVPALMTAHVKLPKIERIPASFSRRLLSEVLREQMKYEGLVITDDLEMAGARKPGESSLASRALQALKAGSDMVMVVWRVEEQIKVRNRIAQAIKSGELPRPRVFEKIRRIAKAKAEFSGQSNNQGALRDQQSLELVDGLIRSAVKWRGGREKATMELFKQRQGEAWRIFVPTKALERIWKRYRPSDHVVVFDHGSEAISRSTVKRIESLMREQSPVVLITPPRVSAHRSLFASLLELFNQKLKTTSQYPMMWVHQGPDPIPLSQNPNERINFGIMTLSSASHRSVHALVQFVQSGIGAR